MYFPLLRGRQYELKALRELSTKMSLSGKIVPIVEPVRTDTHHLELCLDALNEDDVEYVVVGNPYQGEFKDKGKQGCIDFIKNNINKIEYFGFILDEESDFNEIDKYLKIIGRKPFSFIYMDDISQQKISKYLGMGNYRYNIFISSFVSTSYIKNFGKGKTVIIDPCFIDKERGSDYQYNPTEIFRDNFYKSICGFGDYTTLPEKFKDGGGRPYCGVIHLTYEINEEKKPVYISHFLSQIYTQRMSDQARLVQEALDTLVPFVKKNGQYFSFSTAVQEFIDIKKKGINTNLARTKKLSIKHHIELMIEILN
ncbi:sce7725 family protein [Celerinatantimonas sp. MCCC 1A17872]|uniref:sce7725 family protein n=1 Tax=Celerinatantimonas sp. MCCC 1A17872 TaxID=3177514 RepID=UPI0038BE47F4